MLKLPPKAPKAGFYYHYKHDSNKGIRDYAYEVVAVGFHIEDDVVDPWFINYRPLYESAAVFQASKKLGIQCLDNRPLEMWMDTVEKEGRASQRFTKITDPAIIAELEKIKKEMYGS